MIREDVIAALYGTGKWSELTARVAERAGYKCEYCDLDLLSTAEAYKLFEVDHVIPRSAKGPETDLENLALACRHCNSYYKGRWNPRLKVEGDNPSREALILEVRERIIEVRARVTAEMRRMREIIGRPNLSDSD